MRHPALVGMGLIASLAISGCSTLDRDIVQGDAFRHVIATSHSTSSSAPIHLYINGDGRPFSTPHTLARDPSPSSPFVLKLMQQDAQPNAMIGRPCYHGLANDPSCQSALWSRQRFSPAVVDSMVAAALKVSNGRPTVLIGHSGGGTLAMLMAAQMPDLVGVITIAGNLDIQAWADHHGYSALTGSLNPADAFDTTRSIPQMHFFASDDTVVPYSLVQQIEDQLPTGSVQVVSGFDHDCCWVQAWPRLLRATARRFESAATLHSPHYICYQ